MSIKVTEAAGGFTVESQYHAALCDGLEGVGVLSTLPGVEDVPNPDGWGLSLLEAGRVELFRYLGALGWGPVPNCQSCEYWDGTHCEPLAIGGQYALHRER